MFLVEARGVTAVPSTMFDFGDHHLRFGLGRRSLRAALEIFAELLATGAR